MSMPLTGEICRSDNPVQNINLNYPSEFHTLELNHGENNKTSLGKIKYRYVKCYSKQF